MTCPHLKLIGFFSLAFCFYSLCFPQSFPSVFLFFAFRDVVCLFVCLSRCLCLRLCVCLRLCHRLRLCVCLCVSLLPVLEKDCCGAEKTPLCTKNTVLVLEKHLGCWKNTVLELRKHHCRGAEKTPRVWRKHLDAQKIPARC